MGLEKKDFLQEEVGCPDSRVSNMELLRQEDVEFGYVTPGHAPHERAQGDKQGSSTSASSSSASGRVLKKQKSDDGEDPLAPRCTVRKEESKIVAGKIEDIVGRLEKLEMKQTTPHQPDSGPSQSTWRPQHIIIGGWGEGTTREQMVLQAMEF